MDWITDAIWIFSFTQPSVFACVHAKVSVGTRTKTGAFLLSAQKSCTIIKMSVEYCQSMSMERAGVNALPDAGEKRKHRLKL